MEIVTKVCSCGKELMPNVYCNQQRHSCGTVCDEQLPCGHKCAKTCHLKGQCYNSEEELLQKGCGQRCNKVKEICKHRCLEPCHPMSECPKESCQAEIRVYCKCGNRYVNTFCNSVPNKEPIECNSECWKKQRDQKL